MKRILFIDRDGTLIKESPPTYQIDDFGKLEFYPGIFEYMGRIAREMDYELLMVTNQDGLGTASFPEETFWPVQNFVLKSLEGEGVHFTGIYIDRSFPADKAPTRKPGTGMLTEYIDNDAYDLYNSFVIGDRITDVQLAKNLGCKAIWLNNDPALGGRRSVIRVATWRSPSRWRRRTGAGSMNSSSWVCGGWCMSAIRARRRSGST